MASLFFDLARRRPQIEVEAKIYGGCALAFAVAMLPKALGAPADVSQKFYSTMAEWSDIAYVSIVALSFVSREALAFNGIGAALGMLAIALLARRHVRAHGQGPVRRDGSSSVSKCPQASGGVKC